MLLTPIQRWQFTKEKSLDHPFGEAELLAQYQRDGDLEVLGTLYEPYMPLIYGLCLKYLKNDDKSKDAVMQIFEQLITKLKIHQVTNFKSWLYTLARNYCLMDLRSAQKHQFVTMDECSVETSEPVHLHTDEWKEDQLSSMEKCMEKLPYEQKITIQQFYLEQKCYKEISELTGFDMNKVKSYIQNGKRNLKICMEKNGEHE